MKKGQGLVEFALIAPLLIFLLLGTFEVGWALRGYLVLTNATREAARFAARPGYLSNPMSVYTHTLDSLAGSLPFQDTGIIYLHTIKVEDYCTGVVTITRPLDWAYPVTPTSRVDFPLEEARLRVYQHRDSCNKKANGAMVHPHVVIIVEMWYDQPQLFGFPLISNPLTDPVHMYDRTTFRLGVERE